MQTTPQRFTAEGNIIVGSPEIALEITIDDFLSIVVEDNSAIQEETDEDETKEDEGDVAPGNVQNDMVPNEDVGEEKNTEDIPEAGQETDGTKVTTATERIPKDEKGNLIYDKVSPDEAWDAIMEQTEGDSGGEGRFAECHHGYAVPEWERQSTGEVLFHLYQNSESNTEEHSQKQVIFAREQHCSRASAVRRGSV